MASLYRQALGRDFALLDPVLQTFHSETGVVWEGQADVTWAKQRWLRWALMLARMPRAGQQVPLRMVVQPLGNGDGERWIRSFALRKMPSRQLLREGGLSEHFGPWGLSLINKVSDGSLIQMGQKSTLLGISLPQWCGLSVVAKEWAHEGRFFFAVTISLGRWKLLSYTGWLRKACLIVASVPPREHGALKNHADA